MAELEASERKLATERDILRKAAKYFAGEAIPNTDVKPKPARWLVTPAVSQERPQEPWTPGSSGY